MEQVLVLLVQFLLEVGLELLVYFPFDWPWADKNRNGNFGCFGLLLFAGLGCGTGALANLFLHHLLIPWAWLREVNLLLAPLFSGYVSWLVAKWRSGRTAGDRPFWHFWSAFVFTLGFVLIRFAFGSC